MTKTIQLALLGAGVLGVGYLLFRSKPANAASFNSDYLPPVQVEQTQADAAARVAGMLRSALGGRAASGASAGGPSMVAGVLSAANNKNAAVMASIGEKVLPGSGQVFGQVGQAVGGSMIHPAEKIASKAWSTVSSWF